MNTQVKWTVIVPERTAIATGVSKSATELSKRLRIPASVLDYGSGRLRNAYYLVEEGFEVSILDTPFQMENIRNLEQSMFTHIYTIRDEITKQYDAVLCSYVLNVIPFREERESIVRRVYESLKDSGLAFFEVRKKDGILKTKHHEPFEDGYIIGNGNVKTFQKPFARQEFVEYITSFGFFIEQISSTSDSWMIVAKKTAMKPEVPQLPLEAEDCLLQVV